MFTLFKYLFRNANQKEFLGANLDTRVESEKVNDVYLHDIVASINTVNWIAKPVIRTFPVYNQYQTYMCGANALSKALGIVYSLSYKTYVPFSRSDIYQRRFNRPGAGMALSDMFKIASDGVTLEQLTPKELYTDSDADNLVIENFKRDVGKIFAVNNGVYVRVNIDDIASVIQTTGKGVIIATFFNSGEWSKQFPNIVDKYLTKENALRHFVVVTDFTLVDGKKYLVAEDSAHFGGLNQRYLSEEWVNNRVYDAGYTMNFKFENGISGKPSYDGTIISVQKCLRFEGLFPVNVDYFENFGPTTRIAVGNFQKKYGLTFTQTLNDTTINKLKMLYP